MKKFFTPPVLLLLVISIAPCFAVFGNDIEIVAHRGANHLAPENTRAAAQACIDLGVEYVEVDVRASLDGVFYIMHDSEVDRTTDGTGPLAQMNAADIDALDAGSWFSPEFKDERVPRLKEYLEWIKGKSKVYFDVKGGDMEKLVALIHEIGFEKDCFFWFGDKKMQNTFRTHGKELKLKINAYTPRAVERAVKFYDADIVEMPLASLTPEYIQTCRDNKVRIMVYEKEDTEEIYRQILASEADMVNLDKPELFVKLRDELKTSNN